MWTRESLAELVKEKLSDYRFIVVSNREPYIHNLRGKEIVCQVPASGLTTALDPVMRACGGTWIAHGSGNADRRMSDLEGGVAVPPEDPRYQLRRLWLSAEDEEGYYYGFANQALWPLCHIVYTRPVFDHNQWEAYQRVNRQFAEAVAQEAGDRPAFVFIQDYHLALVPRMVRELNPRIISAQFWHIPWPNPEAFRICPWRDEILQGMLGNDLMGFHIRYHCHNFMDTVDSLLECRVDRERYDIHRGGRRTAVREFPISIDFEELNQRAQAEGVDREIQRLRQEYRLGDRLIGIGLDRLDYTKGIPDRFRAIGRFLEKYPDWRERFTFIQAAAPSRSSIPAYQSLAAEVDRVADEVNARFGNARGQPILHLKGHCSQLTLMAMRRMSRFCAVSSLHDGMNLVAKEYAAARFDEDGVLILSPFTGAARELTDALLVNPYAPDHFAEAIRVALEMEPEERCRRMRRMRAEVRENNIYKWAGDIITALTKFDPEGSLWSMPSVPGQGSRAS